MSSADLKRRKRALRREARALRDGLSPGERERMSDEVTRNVLALPAVENATTVVAFSSFGSEVDTRPIIERLERDGRRVALPRVEGRIIVAVAYRSGDVVKPSSFGALEPAGGEKVAPEEIDVVIVPGLAFDRSGHRVGYGRGFYDRFLGALRPDALTVGICFSLQLVDEVPHGRGDRPVDLVVTEHGLNGQSGP
ncbi:MAG TPA: 5-formyltetrahydrofolate cyclo-ligase [Actinomycetota bacterium]